MGKGKGKSRERSSPFSLDFPLQPPSSQVVSGRIPAVSDLPPPPKASSRPPLPSTFTPHHNLSTPAAPSSPHIGDGAGALHRDAPGRCVEDSGRLRPCSGVPPPPSDADFHPPRLLSSTLPQTRPPSCPNPPRTGEGPAGQSYGENTAAHGEPPPGRSPATSGPSSAPDGSQDPSLHLTFNNHLQPSALPARKPARHPTRSASSKRVSLNGKFSTTGRRLPPRLPAASPPISPRSPPPAIATTPLDQQPKPSSPSIAAGSVSKLQSPVRTRPAVPSSSCPNSNLEPQTSLPNITSSSHLAPNLTSHKSHVSIPKNTPFSPHDSQSLPHHPSSHQVQPRTDANQPSTNPNSFKISNPPPPAHIQFPSSLPVPPHRPLLYRPLPSSPLFFPTGAPLHRYVPPPHLGKGILPSPPIFLPSLDPYPCPLYIPITPPTISPFLWLVPVLPLARLSDPTFPYVSRRRRRRKGRKRSTGSTPPPVTTSSASPPPPPPPVITSPAPSLSTISTPLPSTDVISSPSVASVATLQISPLRESLETARPLTSGSRPSAQTSTAARPPSAGSRPSFSEVVSRRIVADLVASAPRRLGPDPARHTPPQTRSRSRLC